MEYEEDEDDREFVRQEIVIILHMIVLYSLEQDQNALKGLNAWKLKVDDTKSFL